MTLGVRDLGPTARQPRKTVDLSDLTRDLDALRREAMTAVAAASDVAALTALEQDILGKKGRLTSRPARDRRPGAGGPSQGRLDRQRHPDLDRRRDRRARDDPPSGRASQAACATRRST
ncbi:MAG: hypothetical protein WKF78_14610 [Candidatus Limnocylindrales bacterium]